MLRPLLPSPPGVDLLFETLTVESKLGERSTFTLTIPATPPRGPRARATLAARPLDPSLSPVLIVEDDRKTMFIYEKFLSLTGFQVVPARTVDDARKQLGTFRPTAIVLDIMLEGEAKLRARRSDAVNKGERRAREVLRRQTVHLARLVDDLLDVSRVTQGKIDLRLEPVDLKSLLTRVVLTTRARAGPRRHHAPRTDLHEPARVGKVLDLLPDVTLIDIGLPCIDGFDGCAPIHVAEKPLARGADGVWLV